MSVLGDALRRGCPWCGAGDIPEGSHYEDCELLRSIGAPEDPPMSERKARAVGVLVADAVYFHGPDLLSLLDALDAIAELLQR